MKKIILIYILVFYFYNTAKSQDSLRSIINKETSTISKKDIPDSNRFTPTQSEIDTADKYLSKFFSNEIDYSSYFKQYIGRIRNGGKVIIVIAGCNKSWMIPTDGIYWPPVGGGKCYFTAEFLLAAKNIKNIQFNPRM